MEAVAVNLISSLARIRGINKAQVEALKESIAEVGLLNPLTVYRSMIARGAGEVEGYRLIAGAHRLEAVKHLGWETVPVRVVELDELHRTIAECDENLCGAQLSPAERAEFTHRRKWAYEQLHPETAHEATLKRGSSGRNVCDPGDRAPRFTADTATRTGQSERKVQLDAERGAKVCNSALAMIKGTHLDTGRYLDQLKDLPTAAQIKRVQTDLTKPKVVVIEDDDAGYRRLMSAWNAASDADRQRFLAEIRPARSA